jgi:hypothetical protein
VKKLAVGRWPLAVFLLFFAARLPLLFVRQPFFDELFTRWICERNVLQALQLDSGPPLYYWLLQLLGCPDGRLVSLLCATIALVALLRRNELVAAALVAVFPPAVLMSVDARAYAFCAMCVTLGALALRREQAWGAAAAFVLAAYAHYYGVLFFPLLWRRWRALAVAVALYVPGFWLAAHQPRAARAWMEAWQWPDALFVRPPVVLGIVIAVLALVHVGRALARPDGLKPVLHWAVPFALAVASGAYVPLRFESVIATPLMLWLAPARRLVLIALGAAFAVWTALGIAEHAGRPPDELRAAATWVARNAGAQTVVASGYLYLETVVQRPAIAFPPEQAEHPGWRAVTQPGSALPPGAFLWVGERFAPELEIIRRARRIDPVFMNSRAIVVKVH